MVDIKKTATPVWTQVSESELIDRLKQPFVKNRSHQGESAQIQSDSYVHRTGSPSDFFGTPRASSAVLSMDPQAAHFSEMFGLKYTQATRDTWSSISDFFQDWHTRGFAQLLSRYTPHYRPHLRDDTTPMAQKVDGTTYKPMLLPPSQTELFSAQGPQASDVQQGALGDCYFLATLAGVATEHPNVIRDNIKPHVDPTTGKPSNGLYDVRLYSQSPTGETQEQWVTVNSRLLRDSQGNELYAADQDIDRDGKKEIWAAIYEKAYASLNRGKGTIDDGYQAIGQGGLGDEAYFAITGRRAMVADPSEMDESDLVAVLSQANPVNGDSIMVGSKSLGSDQITIDEGIPSGHLFTVLGTYTDPDTNEPMVTLRNPWGLYEPGVYSDEQGNWEPPIGTPNNDGIFSIPVSQLQDEFDLMTYPAQSNLKLNTSRSSLGG